MALGRGIVEDHTAFGSGCELKGSKINPCPSAACLVDGEFGGASEVLNAVMGGLGAAFYGFVGDVDGIAAALRDIGSPDSLRAGLAAGAGGLPGGAGGEGVVVARKDVLKIGETAFQWAPAAFLLIAAVAAGGKRLVEYRCPVANGSGALFRVMLVVVANDLAQLGVTLARSDHVGSCVFQHRD